MLCMALGALVLGAQICWGEFCWETTFLFTQHFQAKPCRCSRGVASIIERIDLGCASNLMRVLISLTAPLWPNMSKASDAMFKGINDTERRAFVASLQTILRNIRKHDF